MNKDNNGVNKGSCCTKSVVSYIQYTYKLKLFYNFKPRTHIYNEKVQRRTSYVGARGQFKVPKVIEFNAFIFQFELSYIRLLVFCLSLAS